jgi:hypothetical protein
VALLAENLNPSDQVVFFFSGHGLNDAKTGDSYLLPIDTKAKDIVGSALNLQADVLSPLASVGITNVVALVDACQKTLTKDKGLSVVGVNQVKAAGSAVVITATSPGKVSYEDPKGSNGLFTKALLAGLQGEADLSRDGQVSVAELERWLPSAVGDYALEANLSQKPMVYDNGSDALQPSLVKLASPRPASAEAPAADSATAATTSAAPSTKAQFVQFKLPTEVVATIRILDASGRELQVLADITGASPRLEPGTYKVEVQDRLYQYYEYEKTIMVADAKQTVSLDLKPNFGSLKLGTDAADGVEVLINGEKKGTISGGSLRIDKIKSGSYTVVLSKDLYETKSQAIQIEDGKTASISVKLAANFFTLEVAAPSGQAASLYVDGQARGSLPLTIKLPFRDAALKVVPDDSRYREWSGAVSPKAKGSVEKPTVSLAPRLGTLTATTNPDSEAELVLAPANGGATSKIGTAPLDYESLIGDYIVTATTTLG